MSIRRIGVLLGRELWWGPKNFIFIFALVVPIVISLLVTLLFGNLLSGKPKLGVHDLGRSDLVQLAQGINSVIVKEYDSEAALFAAAERGAIDIGITLADDFDRRVQRGAGINLVFYTWGESLLKDRVIVGTLILNLIRQVAGQEIPVDITTEVVGDNANVPWEERLLPLIVLMTILIGAVMVPSTSLVEEKQKRTLSAVAITPTSLREVFVAKSIVGIGLSLFMGIVILVINQAFGRQPLLLILIMFLGATLGAVFGIILGALVKDVDTLFATIKGMGILLYAPAFVYMFPAIPQWIGRLFPTYYIVGPLVEISQRGAVWSDIALDIGILVALIVVLTVVMNMVGERLQRAVAL